MDHLTVGAHIGDVKGDRTLHAVQVIIEAGTWIYKYRCGDTQKVQLLCKCLLKKIFDGFDCHLGIVKIQIRMISGGEF